MLSLLEVATIVYELLSSQSVPSLFNSLPYM